MVDVDHAPGDSFNKKIRNAQLAQYNYILGRVESHSHTLTPSHIHTHTHTHTLTHPHTVVGEKEETNKTANVRTRDNKVHGERSVDDLIGRLMKLKESKAADDGEVFQ